MGIRDRDHGDRISAAIINGNMQKEFAGSVPIFSFSLSGIVLSPTHNKLLCSYAYDVGSLNRVCTPRGVSSTCVPGCTAFDTPWPRPPAVQWCTDVLQDQWPCAWKPSDTRLMLQKREMLRSAGRKPFHKTYDDGKFYVEMIFDAEEFMNNLPHSIDAVFYLNEDCTDSMAGPKCRDYAIGAHRTMLRHFELSLEEMPLLRLDPWNWDTPFSDEGITNG